MEEMRNERYQEEEIDLLQLMSGVGKYFRKLWWLCILFVLVGNAAAIGLLFFARTPMYQSSASFTVTTGEEGGSYGFYYDSGTANQLSMTFPYILESGYFRSLLLEHLGTDRLNGTITAETISGSNVVTMKVQSSNPQDAYNILTAAIEIYPEAAHFVLGNISFSMLMHPQIPSEPYNQPSIGKCCLIGTAAGLLTSLALLILLATVRKNICLKEEMRQITSLRCLASIPQVHIKARTKKRAMQLSFLDPSLPHCYTESIRVLKNRVVKAMEANEQKVLLVTSTVSGEGKSVTAVNLAGQLAMDGARVLLIDGDLRKQKDGQLLNLSAEYGLVEACQDSDEKAIWNGIEQNSRQLKESGLLFLGGCNALHQPASLLSSPALKRCIQSLREQVDYIIIDSSPCGMFQDTAVLAECADSVLFLLRYDRLPAGVVRDGIRALGGQHVSFLGYAFNICPEGMGGYGYGYGYGKYGYGHYGSYSSGRKKESEFRENSDKR